MIDKLLSSTVKDTSILCIEPGNNLHTFGFSGLNIKNSDIHYYYPTREVNTLPHSHFNYVIIHGFLLNELSEKINVSCDTFVIDLLGEGGSLVELFGHYNLDIVESKNIKVLAPIDDYKGLCEKYKDVDFFTYDFCGPRNFCSKYNHMMHHDLFSKWNDYTPNKVLMGLSWSDKPRERLYSCLNNRKESHRSILINELLKGDITSHGYVSNINGSGEVSLEFYENDVVIKKINDKQIILDSDNNPSDRFGVHQWGKKSYIDVVTETSHNLMRFMTEKSVKPFYNLQLPIILGYTNIIQHLRDLGFDMFDDIIDHSYDTVESNVTVYDFNHKIHSVYNSLAQQKSKMIVNELKRLSKLDFHKIYLDLKERLIHNQNLLYELTIEDNNLVEDYGKWIFGDNITFNKNDYIEKIYI